MAHLKWIWPSFWQPWPPVLPWRHSRCLLITQSDPSSGVQHGWLHLTNNWLVVDPGDLPNWSMRHNLSTRPGQQLLIGIYNLQKCDWCFSETTQWMSGRRLVITHRPGSRPSTNQQRALSGRKPGECVTKWSTSTSNKTRLLLSSATIIVS